MTKQHDGQLDTETLILQAAEKEFLEKGYSGANTTAIAEAAGVTHAMFHYYFRKKEKLFEKIFSEKIKQLKDMMFSAIENPELPLKKRIELGVERHFDFIAANPLLPRFIFNELHLNPARVEEIKTDMITMATSLLNNLQKAIDREAEQGNCKQADARTVLLDIISLNIFPFVAEPIIKGLLAPTDENMDTLLEQRKKDNVQTILTKLNLA